MMRQEEPKHEKMRVQYGSQAWRAERQTQPQIQARTLTPETDLKQLFSVMTRDAVAQVKEQDHEILCVIKVLGGDAGKYKRERKAAIRAVMSEIYPPPRVTAAA